MGTGISYRKLGLVLFITCLLQGCSGPTTRYYFATADLDDESGTPRLTYYRVTVTGHSVNVKSSFQTGFYDAEALHQLFGEVKKPESTTRPAYSTGSYQLKFNEASRTWELVNNNERFTLIYGANADALAQQVQLFADSDDAGKQFARLIATAAGGKAFSDAQAAKQKADDAKKAATKLTEDLKPIGEGLKDDAAPMEARKALLKAVQAAAKAAGSAATFTAKDEDASLDAAFEQAEKVYDTLAK